MGADDAWEGTSIEPSRLAGALRGAAPELAPVEPLHPLGFGFYSYVFETASGWIVRVARTADAAERHAMEAQVLPALAKRLTVAIPEPQRVLPPRDEAPFGAFAYRRLPGRLMTAADATSTGWEAIADRLGTVLASLHGLDVPRGRTLGVPDPGGHPAQHYEQLRATVMSTLTHRLEAKESRRLNDWWDEFLGDVSLRHYDPAIIHSDPWWGNLLLDDGQLSGIIDWEFVSIADPAIDVGCTLHMGEPFSRRVLDAYSQSRAVDDTFEHRARLLWNVRVFYGFQFAIERDDEDEFMDSLAKLRDGDILA